jgi:hypothetical protein
MSKDQASGAAIAGTGDVLTEAEANLGQALALIHRVLPRLDEPTRAADVQAALQKAAGCIELARQVHQRTLAIGKAAVAVAAQTGLESELVAVISAAVATVLGRPYRLVSVQPVAAPVPHLNVWALEGRTQIFQSHKIR